MAISMNGKNEKLSWHNAYKVEDHREIFRKMEDQIKRLHALVPQWISVKDKLPEKSGKYWVHVERSCHRGVYRDYETACYKIEAKIFYRKFYEDLPIDEVLHWMLILEAPEVEG